MDDMKITDDHEQKDHGIDSVATENSSNNVLPEWFKFLLVGADLGCLWPHFPEYADKESAMPSDLRLYRDPVFDALGGAKEHARTFLETVFDKDDLLEMRLLSNGGSNGGSQWHKPARILELHEFYARQNLGGQNIYISALPRLRHGGKKDADAAPGQAAWADFDHTTPEEAKKIIADALLPPATLLVNSGNGVHAWWRFAEKVSPNQICALGKDMAHILGSDRKVCNPSRIMRLPGFYNVKDPENPKPCYIVERS